MHIGSRIVKNFINDSVLRLISQKSSFWFKIQFFGGIISGLYSNNSYTEWFKFERILSNCFCILSWKLENLSCWCLSTISKRAKWLSKLVVLLVECNPSVIEPWKEGGHMYVLLNWTVNENAKLIRTGYYCNRSTRIGCIVTNRLILLE